MEIIRCLVLTVHNDNDNDNASDSDSDSDNDNDNDNDADIVLCDRLIILFVIELRLVSGSY